MSKTAEEIKYPMMTFLEVRKKYNDETGENAVIWDSGKAFFEKDYVQWLEGIILDNEPTVPTIKSDNSKVVAELEKEKDEALRLLNDAIKLIHSLPDLLHDSLGDHTAGNDYEITSLSGERYITHKWVGSGEPLKQWIKSEIDKALS